jgi:hypothetical protein
VIGGSGAPVLLLHGYPQTHLMPTSKRSTRAGHFAAWEQPQLFTEEVRAAFRSLR